MPFKRVQTSSGDSSFKPFMEDWAKQLSDSQKKKLQGKVYLIESIRFNESKKNGFFLETADFTVYSFRSSDFIKQIEEADHPEQLRGMAPCLEIDFETKKMHHLGFDDDQECTWYQKGNNWSIDYPKSISSPSKK